MGNKLAILHISDAHIHDVDAPILGRAEAIARSTFCRLPAVSSMLIIFSGDIAATGTEKQYNLATTFLQEIKFFIEKEKPGIFIEFCVCPGNHDCNFHKDDETRQAVLEHIRNQGSPEPSSSLIKTATRTQEEFFAFRDAIKQTSFTHNTNLAWHQELEIDGISIGIRSLNLAWMSEIKEKQGTLIFPPSAVIPFGSKVDIAISVLHHPFNWLGQVTYRPFQANLRNQSHLIFTGHEHVQNVIETSDLQSTATVTIEGGVLYEKKDPENSTLNVLTIDIENKNYLTELYRWDGKRYSEEIEEEKSGSLRPLPTKGGAEFPLKKDFEQSLNDPGANFSHSAKKELTLDDIFVWPELRLLDDPAPVKKQVSASHLENIENLNSGVFLRGDEKSGKSTLLRRYFHSYYNRGYLPLYFRATWFNKKHADDPLKAIRFALEHQHLKKDHSAWLQEPKDKRLLLIDDVDGSSLTPDVLSACLEVISPYFGGAIVTVTDEAAAMNLLSTDRVSALAHFSNYELREFGHKKRFELVCKWAEIGGLQEQSSERWMETIDRWEKDLTTAVGQQFVPSAPLFLLTLLQSFESGRTADLQNSAFGHYYEFLVTSAFQNVSIERDQWNEVMNYCANFAWYIYSRGVKSAPMGEFSQFNDAFSREFTPVVFARRLRDLVKAGIISEFDDNYGFKYPYLYYFFLGQYFADRIHDQDTVQTLESLCDDLYLRDNANILLFTSHHTKSPIIYERISRALENCFSLDAPFDFSKDTQILNNLVDSAPQLIYSDSGNTTARRAQVRAQEDAPPTADLSPEDNLPEIASAVTRLFRGMEILGQFLKNHYGTTRKPIKEQLIRDLIESALRGLKGTTKTIFRDTELLASHIENALTEQRPDLLPDQLRTLSRRIVFDLIGILTFGFIQKAGTVVGSPYLKENLTNVVDENQSIAYSLIEMGYQFDLPQKIPFDKLKKINKSIEKNVFCRSLLQTMALRHLHLFKVDYKDKQRLCEELGITLALGKPQRIQHTDKPDWLPGL